MSLKGYLHNIAFAGKALSDNSLICGFISLSYHCRKVLLKVTDSIIPFLVITLAQVPICQKQNEIIHLGIAFFFSGGKKLYLFRSCLTRFQPGTAAGGQAQTCSVATVPVLQTALCIPTHHMTQQFTVHKQKHSSSTGTSWQCVPWAPGELPRQTSIWAWPIPIMCFLSPPNHIFLLILTGLKCKK